MPSLLFERFYLIILVGLYTQNLENNMHVICLSILAAGFFPGICCRAGSMKGLENGGQHWQKNRDMDYRVGQSGGACPPFERALCFRLCLYSMKSL